MAEVRVSPRERLVLTAIIDLYIATGEPVASQAVAHYFAGPRRSEFGDDAQCDGGAGGSGTAGAAAHFGGSGSDGGSLSVLRGADYAGRSCLASGAGGIGVSPERGVPLSEARRGQIEESFTGVASIERIPGAHFACAGADFKRAGRGAGQCDGRPGAGTHSFFAAFAGRVLAVLVTQAGAVQDRVLAVDRDLTHLELETAARYLNEIFRGWPIERIRTEVARRDGGGARGVPELARVGRGALPQGCAGAGRSEPP